jgi:hypothetical protein
MAGFTAKFDLYSYTNIEGDDSFFGNISIAFEKEGMVLRDGYEHDSDGYTITEIENYYSIDSLYYEKILSLVSDEYKNESILSEYENANKYYEILSTQEEKLLFINILNFLKLESKNGISENINKLLEFLDANDINYRHDTNRY